jgi:hypothetical protein
MSYLKFPLGNQRGGTLVRVNLQGVESDVFLVDSANLTSFERGSDFHYTGGHYKSSPIQLVTPSAGEWTTVVVPTGGRVRASVSVVHS